MFEGVWNYWCIYQRYLMPFKCWSGFCYLLRLLVSFLQWHFYRGAGLAQWLEHSPPTNVSGFDSPTRRHMWVEFVVGSLLCSKRFFSRYSGFPLSSKTNISKFQFDLDVRHFSHEPLAQVIAWALPVLDIKFKFTNFILHLHICMTNIDMWQAIGGSHLNYRL